MMATLLVGAAAALAGPALADVKAGVDAWSHGDYATAVREWQGPAEHGDADAQFNLAQAYKLGRGVPQDLAKAEDLFGRAAAQGHIQASDNFGLLLFQRGEHVRALPYIRGAADRGDPRAQYLLGIAHFNGDTVPKDWVRAYALVNLASQAGLPQGRAAVAQMDQYIPLPQRQQGIALSAELASQAEATRARQLAAVDLGSSVAGAASVAAPPLRLAPGVVAAAPPLHLPPPATASAAGAVGAAGRVAGSDGPATAGADYARPTHAAAPHPAHVAPPPPTTTAAIVTTAKTAPAAAETGAWRIQLGAFAVSGHAETLWSQVRDRPELVGHSRVLVGAGGVTKLQAGGFPNRAAAEAACARLSAAGVSCLVTRG
ncbi:MAG: SPOR domain-containing protein [Novosphingobium sp.]|nr:SPOR domain-containing protein [Novosphingobium sp.]